MKIALIGYGKMGKAIEEIARHRGHEIVLRITRNNAADCTPALLQQADAAIEFTSPQSAFDHVKTCLESGVPVVCGSTGWTRRLPELEALCREKKGAFIYASNFSVGVNIFFELNKKLAALMARRPEYEVLIEETHHTQKKDAPSGTAITLAEQILGAVDRKKQWVNDLSDNPEDLEIISQRVDPAPGTHHVKYSSVVDTLELIHTAHNRTGFATGAVLAAEFLKNRTGVFSMPDVLGFTGS
jgi:4-hydroxy-tetrahydrodipicolinate reductase